MNLSALRRLKADPEVPLLSGTRGLDNASVGICCLEIALCLEHKAIVVYRKNEVARMIIKINGKEENLEIKSNLRDLLASKGLSSEKIVVEHNFNIIPKDQWQNIILKENDNIEIVSFVSGG